MSRTDLIPPQQLGMPQLPLVMQPRSKNYSSQAVDINDDYVFADFTNWSAANGMQLTQVTWTPAQFKYFDENIWVTSWNTPTTLGSLPAKLYVCPLNGVNMTVPAAQTASIPASSFGNNIFQGMQGARVSANSMALYDYAWVNGNASSFAIVQRFFNLSGTVLTVTREANVSSGNGGALATPPIMLAQTPNAIGELLPAHNGSTQFNFFGLTNFDVDANGCATNFTHAQTYTALFSPSVAYQVHTVDNSKFAISTSAGDTYLLPAVVANLVSNPPFYDQSFYAGCQSMIGKQRFSYIDNTSTGNRYIMDTSSGVASLIATFGGAATVMGTIRLNDAQFMQLTYTTVGSTYVITAQPFTQVGTAAPVAVGAAQTIGTVTTGIDSKTIRGFTLPGNRLFVWIGYTNNISSSTPGGYYAILKGAT